MFYTLYAFVNNIIYLLKTERPITYKLEVLLCYCVYTLIVLIPFIPRPNAIKIFKYKLLGFDFKALQYLYGEIFVKNEYFFVSKNIKPIIFDLGSNIGASVLFFKHLYPDSMVVAFEPDPETFSLLKKNIKINKLKNVSLYNYALSDRKGKIPFYIGAKAGSLMMSSLRGRISKRTISVRTIRLSEFVKNKKIDFIKMDIEGNEARVARDVGKNNLWENINEAVIEYHHNIEGNKEILSEFLSIFEKAGFRYKIDTQSVPIYSKDRFQDILILFYK